MTVRCERCLTVYEFDGAAVTEAGVTVQCAHCGNQFRLRRLASHGRGDEIQVEEADRLESTLPWPITPLRPSAGPAGGAVSEPPAAPWFLRRQSTGEVWPLTGAEALRHWISEYRVLPDDEVAEDGKAWRMVGELPEFAPLFRAIAQAQQAQSGPPATRKPTELIFGRPLSTATPTMPFTITPPAVDLSEDEPAPRGEGKPSGQAAHAAGGAMQGAAARGARGAASSDFLHEPTPLPAPAPAASDLLSGRTEESMPVVRPEDIAVTPSAPPRAAEITLPSLRSAETTRPSMRAVAADGIGDRPGGRRRGTRAMLVVGGLCAVLVAVGVVWLARRSWMDAPEGGPSAEVLEALRLGAQHLRLDSEPHLRLAEQEFTRARTIDPKNLDALVGLAEVNVVWASYLLADGRAVKEPGPASSLTHLGQIHLADARRYAIEALALRPDLAEAHRVQAAYLVVSEAPAAEVERELGLAGPARAGEAAVLWVRGLLLARDGQADEARRVLAEANRAAQRGSGQNLVRVDMLLAQAALASGHPEEARAALERALEASPEHDRARRMLALLQTEGRSPAPSAPGAGAAETTAGAAPPPAAGAALPAAAGTTSPASAPPPAPASAPTASAGAAGAARPEPKGYDALVVQGQRLAERGRSREAQQLFEKALAERPDGVEALMGIAYCLLDSERYAGAIERFQRVRRVAPGNDEALIGLAETYKARGDKARALEYYRQYLASFPSGSKVDMARANVRDLEPEVGRASPSRSESEVKETPPGPAATPPAPAPSQDPPAPRTEPSAPTP